MIIEKEPVANPSISFSQEFFLGDFLDNYIKIFSKIENDIRNDLEVDHTTFNSTSELERHYKKKFEEVNQLITIIVSYDCYDTLTLACLSGIYYDVQNDSWVSITTSLNALSVKIEELESYMLNKITDTFVKFDTHHSISRPLEAVTEESERIIAHFYSSLYDYQTFYDDFKLNVTLFINLSKRLFFDAQKSIRDIQSKHIDFSLNDNLASLSQLLKDNEYQKALYLINLRLAEFDEFLSCNDEFIEELIDYYTKLQVIAEVKSKQEPFLKITFHKCIFLMYKILKRVGKSDHLTNEGVVISTFYNQHSVVFSTSFIEKLLKEEDSPFLFFLTKTSTIYDLELRSNELVQEKELKDFTTEDLHRKCKQVKHSLRDYGYKNNLFIVKSNPDKQLSAILEKIKSTLHVDTKDSQKFTKTSMSYLVTNTKLLADLVKIVEELDKFEEIETAFSKMLKAYDLHYQRCDFDNNEGYVFPNVQFMRYFIIQVENLLEKTKNIIGETRTNYDTTEIEKIENSISEIIEKVGNVTKAFFKFLTILKNKNYYPIYNDLKNCKTEKLESFNVYSPRIIDNKVSDDIWIELNTKVFLDSSYVLPSNYSFLKSDMEERIRGINNINSQILSLLEVFLTKNVEKTLETKVKENQFYAIQTISVYAIVITYILGSLTVLTHLDGALNVMPYFMMLLALVLGFFIVCIRFLFITEKFHSPFRNHRRFWNFVFHRWTIFLGFLAILGAVILWVALPKFENAMNERPVKSPVDSASAKLAGDTLKPTSDSLKQTLRSAKPPHR